VPGSPLDPHAARPAELQARLAAERRGRPFLIYFDDSGAQVLVELGAAARLTIGRAEGCGVRLGWDTSVSRTHAELFKLGDDWAVDDDGLVDRDVLTLGGTEIAFRDPESAADEATTAPPISGVAAAVLSEPQRRVLEALCRPLFEQAVAAPASNQAIAAELVLSVDAVKRTLRGLFRLFGVDGLPQNEKRAALAREALRRGAIRPER
jgi:hypothetical protein